MIIEEARRCKRLVRGLLDFSRPPALGMAEVDVNELIENTVATARSQRVFKGVDISLDLGTEIPRFVSDPDRLRQVFMNLLLNSAQAMPAGGGDIHISSGLEEGSGRVRIVFRDTGKGVESGDIERIFEPFYTTKRPGEGTGLGLAICRRLLEEQGGGIEAFGRPGVGAVFSVYLSPGQNT
jgi:signal transduction histidine kinase